MMEFSFQLHLHLDVPAIENEKSKESFELISSKITLIYELQCITTSMNSNAIACAHEVTTAGVLI